MRCVATSKAIQHLHNMIINWLNSKCNSKQTAEPKSWKTCLPQWILDKCTRNLTCLSRPCLLRHPCQTMNHPCKSKNLTSSRNLLKSSSLKNVAKSSVSQTCQIWAWALMRVNSYQIMKKILAFRWLYKVVIEAHLPNWAQMRSWNTYSKKILKHSRIGCQNYQILASC